MDLVTSAGPSRKGTGIRLLSRSEADRLQTACTRDLPPIDAGEVWLSLPHLPLNGRARGIEPVVIVSARGEEHADKGEGMIVYTDGGCHSNGTDHAAGYGSFKVGGRQVRFELMATTNNQAEYQSLIRALEHCQEAGLRQFDILTDSQLMVNQIGGMWECKNPELRPLRDRARVLQQAVGARLRWVERAVIVRELGH